MPQPELQRLSPDTNVIRLQRLLSANGYFREAQPSHGIFEDVTHREVEVFQMQHQGADGNPLLVDGVVGDETWWALEHPSGDDQRSHLEAIIPEGITEIRRSLIELVLEEHAKPVSEVPDGSNRSPDIDMYWGDTGLLGLPWCCAFVSWALHETLGHYPIGEHHVGVQTMWRAARRSGLRGVSAKPGDVFVQIKSGGTGHTGFVIGVGEDGSHIYTCEGNTGNRLKIGRRNVDTIHHYIDCLGEQDLEFGRLDFDARSVDADGTR